MPSAIAPSKMVLPPVRRRPSEPTRSAWAQTSPDGVVLPLDPPLPDEPPPVPAELPPSPLVAALPLEPPPPLVAALPLEPPSPLGSSEPPQANANENTPVQSRDPASFGIDVHLTP